ncbi:thiazolinyl imide reductase [Desulfofarcimen acetoxidans DSM 771]|uniref:Thiazolinyl imide reductase n=1 Tax=Desulfofarcimen acetoxidans (strain ATCC 49208 / DSM 771 / KCTC 5769 / VKM B-1644 / 5575) TaxID=485916 RepID=C8W158_DESAS|nr:Gfo/Idh/MocA family oxidoreductase [Desulfofarcimen acetoxidans]ACV63454.1 thiazolinyl imide reductase [Desulfofarcimen acetoxidans DSM 771]
MERPLRVVVCGTTFGRIYLDAIKQLSKEYKLVGIVARGSEQAGRCAQEYGIPLYTDVNRLTKEETDAACVVVRSTVVGGQGSYLANNLLMKGVHVLQEHPIHYDDLAECFRNARQHSCCYYLNSFYPDLVTVYSFIETALKVLKNSKLNYIEASCSLQVLFPLVDILGKVLGGFRPWSFASVSKSTAEDPFSTVIGQIKDLPVTLRIQNQINPADPDNNTHLLHRIVIGTDSGNLIMTDSHGIVLWCPNMYVPRTEDGVLDIYGTSSFLSLPVMEEVVSLKNKTFQSIFTEVWPSAMKRTLQRFRNIIMSGKNNSSLSQYMLTACQVWQDISNQLGPVQIISGNQLKPITLSDL